MRIVYDSKTSGSGYYEAAKSKLAICKNGLGDAPTAAHETFHALDEYLSAPQAHVFAESVLKDAYKNLGIRGTGKKGKDLAFELTGLAKSNDKAYEIFAYGLQAEYSGKGNRLSSEILKVLKEKYK